MNRHIFHYMVEIGFLFFNALILNPPLLSATPSIIDRTTIDGLDKIENGTSLLKWHHLDHAAVGYLAGGNGSTVIYPIMNGEEWNWEWTPDWSEPTPAGIRYKVVASVFVDLWPALPANGFRRYMAEVSGSGQSEIGPQPSAAANGKSKVESDASDYGIKLNSVPEPATMLLVGAGLAGFGMLRRKFK